jgi:serine/threonine protein kinase
MAVQEQQIETIFHQALEYSDVAERTAFIDTACDQNKPLRTEVQTLLTCFVQAKDFLETPPVASDYDISPDASRAGPGSTIGSYKILEKIGEGGMAIVYMAQQQHPVQRKVALKLLKLGMDSKQVIARFEAERQVLALMDHPSIAKVFDAGTTDTGRPYFVMELVKGVSITQFCDTNHLSTAHRLDLFMAVCQAVQHAHQKGIIHRDLKPSNVMVTLHNGKPMPKVIDFDIAKATNRRLTEKTFFTHYAQIIGTPEYMSPEQAQMSDQEVDARTDVYSLGVLLYELLTGKPPFEASYLRSKSYAEIQRILQEEEPTRPSTKISTLGEASIEIADLRQTSPEALHRLIRADLDWIVMKTLEKDRNQRYPSASELAADLLRHSNHEPVLAGPPSTWYSLKKYTRRHRSLITTLAAVCVTIIVGLCVSTGLLIRIQQAMRTVTTLQSRVETTRHFSIAQRLHGQGSYQAALAEIEPFLQNEFVEGETHLLYAQILFDLGRHNDAEAVLIPLMADLQVASVAHNLLSQIKRYTHPDQAQVHRKQTKKLMPASANLYVLRASAAITPGDALQWLNQALELDGSHYAAHESRALLCYSFCDFTTMQKDAEALIVARSKDYLGYALLALAQREKGELQRALTNHNRAIKHCETEHELPILHDQRQETYWRLGNYQSAMDDAKVCIRMAPDTPAYRATLGRILFRLGRYQEAKDEFVRIKQKAWKHVLRTMIGYALDAAASNEPLRIPDTLKNVWPYHWLPHYVDLYQSLDHKATRLIRGTIGLSSWSPDGRQLAYTRSTFCGWNRADLSQLDSSSSIAAHGIAVLDIHSGHTRVLTTSGGGAAWSPDGASIAYTRAKSLSAEQDGDIYIVPATGGEPKRLVEGGHPHWTRHPTRLYYRSRKDSAIYYIDVNDADGKPVRIASCQGLYPAVSPDERYLADGMAGELRVTELSSGEELFKWTVPGPEPYCCVRWSPDGKEISLSALARSHYCSGLWVFNVENKQGHHLLDAEAICCNWSRDRSQVAFDIFFPVGELWLTRLDPTLPTWRSLPQAQTRAQYLQSEWHEYVNSYARAWAKGWGGAYPQQSHCSRRQPV